MKMLKGTTIIAKLFASLVTREASLINDGMHVAAEFEFCYKFFDAEKPDYRGFLQAVENTKTIFSFDYLIKIIANYRFGNSHNAHYLQLKTIQKIIKFVIAFGYKDFRALDPHTKNILMHVMINQGVIRSSTAFAVLTRCELTELDIVDDVRDRDYMSKYSHGTGSSQMSSTKEMFRVLGVTNGIKGEREAPIIFTDEAKTAFIEYFEVVNNRVNKHSPVTVAPAAPAAPAVKPVKPVKAAPAAPAAPAASFPVADTPVAFPAALKAAQSKGAKRKQARKNGKVTVTKVMTVVHAVPVELVTGIDNSYIEADRMH